ncbi:MAG: hypothetical protein AAGP08_00650 [Pseudomonadota bacterium]
MRRTIVTLATLISATLGAQALEPGRAWHLLDQVEITEVEQNNEWLAVKAFPPELRAAADGFTIEGYYLPIEAQGYVQSFLLIRDQDDCPFCGFGSGYGPSLEVSLKRPIGDRVPYSRIRVRGELQLIDDPGTYLAYRLTNARVVRN